KHFLGLSSLHVQNLINPIYSASSSAYTLSSGLSHTASSDDSLARCQKSVSSSSGVTNTSVPSGRSISSNNCILPSLTIARTVLIMCDYLLRQHTAAPSASKGRRNEQDVVMTP